MAALASGEVSQRAGRKATMVKVPDRGKGSMAVLRMRQSGRPIWDPQIENRACNRHPTVLKSHVIGLQP
jgi:hypothetical protein